MRIGKIHILILLLFAASYSFAGNLTDALRYIDNGKIDKAKQILAEMMKKSPDSSEALLLDAILTTDASKALEKFNYIYSNNPTFKYADLCLFRIYSYNYAIGNYRTAERYLARLRNEFPDSPYAASEGELPKISGKVTAGKSSKSDMNYTIQVGAFSNYSNAKNLANKIKQDGFRSRINKKIVKGAIFNVVTVGFFRTKESAIKTARELERRYSLSPKVSKIPD